MKSLEMASGGFISAGLLGAVAGLSEPVTVPVWLLVMLSGFALLPTDTLVKYFEHKTGINDNADD